MNSFGYLQILLSCPVKGHSSEATKQLQLFDHLFANGFEALAKTIEKDFRISNALVLKSGAYQDLADSLRLRLSRLLSPVLEANCQGVVARAEAENIISQKRTDAQEKEVLQWFLQTMQSEGKHRLFETSPYLKNTVLSLIEDWTTSTTKFLQRLNQDIEELSRRINPPQEEYSSRELRNDIKHIQSNLSDPHNGGEMVKIVTCTDGRTFVYKPRPLAAEEGFCRLLARISETHSFTPLYIPWVINKKEYGWMEYLPPAQTIPSQQDALQYARQFGSLCTLWYLLGGTDLHKENILITTKGVVIVDCETIFGADLQYSVLNEAVRPNLEPNATQHSILGTQALVAFISDLNPQDETIHHVDGAAGFRKLFSDKVAHKISWDTFVNEVCHAIETTLLYFQKQPADAVMGLVRDCFSNGTPLRLVLRPTSSYDALLHNLVNNFDVLQQPAAPLAYITEQLHGITLPYLNSMDPQAVIGAEAEQLAQLDVPYFTRLLGRRHMYSNTGFACVLTDLRDFAALEYRLAWLQQPSCIENQIKLAKMALIPEVIVQDYTKLDSNTHAYTQYYRHTESFYLYLPNGTEAAILKSLSNIADRLLAELPSAEHIEYAFCITQYGNIYQPVPTYYSLLTGWAGKLLFLGVYAALIDNTTVAHRVRQELSYFMQLGQNPDYVLAHRRSGFGMGYQSLLYTFECLTRLGILGTYPAHLVTDTLQPSSVTSYHHDFVAAVSGNAALAGMFANTVPSKVLQDWSAHLKQSIKHLLGDWDTKNDKKRIGLAHGALGPCLAASKLYVTSGDAELKSLALALIEAEERLLQKTQRANEPLGSMNGWCFGSAGRALTYYHVGQAFNIPGFVEKARNLTTLDQKVHEFSDHTLCCGSLGFLAAHLTVHKDLPAYQDKAYRLQKFREFYADPRQLLKKSRTKSACMMPTDLFYGLSGLGMVLLYCLDPNATPAVWTGGFPLRSIQVRVLE